MSIDMILGMAESQTQDIKNLVTKQNEAYTELQKSLAEFILQTDKLKGVTYDSAKKYCAVVIEPLVRGCILLNEEISRANENYINTYKSEVDTVSLKQQELERLIREAEGQIRRVEHLLNLLYQEDPINYSQISMAEENKETYRKLKNELEEKLRKLLAFNAKSPSFFSEVETLKSSIDQGLAQAEKSWSPTSKTFNLPSRSDMGWVDRINEKYRLMHGLSLEEINKDYIVKDFMITYGFDKETAELLCKLQEEILAVAIKEKWSNRKLIYEYNRIIASLVPKNYVSFRWEVVAGTIKEEILSEVLKKYKFSEDEIQILFDNIKRQHNSSTHKDFAHEAVQLSTFANTFGLYPGLLGGFSNVIWLGRVVSKIMNTNLSALSLVTSTFRQVFPSSQGKTKMNTKEDIMFKMKNWDLENKEVSFKGDIDSGRYDDGDFNSDLDAINAYNRVMNVNKEDIFKVLTQYNFGVKHNTINRVSEFYKIHGYGNYDQGKIAVERIVNADTIAKGYISSEYTKEQKKKHQEDFFDYLERGKFKNVE